MAKQRADYIFYNGTIYTVNPAFDVVEAMAVKGGKVLATGTNAQIRENFTAVEQQDLQGNAVYPGFIDAHCHFLGYGLTRSWVELMDCDSFAGVLQKLKQLSPLPGEWIKGSGWNDSHWHDKPESYLPYIDRLFPGNPVILIRTDGHAAIVNSHAMRLASIDAGQTIDGGEVVTDSKGNPTGLLIDKAYEVVYSLIPSPAVGERIEALKIAERDCLSHGITAIADAGLESDDIALISQMQEEGKLDIRTYLMLLPTEGNLSGYCKNPPVLTEKLNICAVKVYADGALGSGGARLMEPYADNPGKYGLWLTEPELLFRYAALCLKQGFQLNVHAIGDAAVRMVLDVYEETFEKYAKPVDHRWRIEHAQIVADDDFERFGRLGVIPSIQSAHAISDMGWVENKIGKHRMRNAYAYRRLLDVAGIVANGSDFPVEPIDPVFTFYSAVFRKNRNGIPEGGFYPENALTRVEALKSMTSWAAIANRTEKVNGSLEPGKAADFILMDTDLVRDPGEKVKNAQILQTWINGKLKFNGDE